jgi:hypothetical protein
LANLTAIRTGLKTNLNTLTAANPTLTVSAYVMNNPNPPLIWVRPNPDVLIDYHLAMRDGYETWHLVVQAYAGAIDDIAAQQTTDAFLASTGTSSVKAAVESDLTLGGACNGLLIRECRGYTEFSRPDGATLIGAEWDVEVHA